MVSFDPIVEDQAAAAYGQCVQRVARTRVSRLTLPCYYGGCIELSRSASLVADACAALGCVALVPQQGKALAGVTGSPELYSSTCGVVTSPVTAAAAKARLHALLVPVYPAGSRTLVRGSVCMPAVSKLYGQDEATRAEPLSRLPWYWPKSKSRQGEWPVANAVTCKLWAACRVVSLRRFSRPMPGPDTRSCAALTHAPGCRRAELGKLRARV